MKPTGRCSHITFCYVSLWALLLPMQIRAGDSITGNVDNGKLLAEQQCDRCHGSGGVSDDPDTPHLAAQSAAYFVKQMRDYKSRTRDDKNMYKRARKLNERQFADLAVWYESQPLPELVPLSEAELTVPKLVKEGDAERDIPACDICHGKDGKNVVGEVPILAGQYAEYLVSTMQYFREGSRSNDPGSVVQLIVRNLSDEEIETLARYYAALGGRPAD